MLEINDLVFVIMRSNTTITFFIYLDLQAMI